MPAHSAYRSRPTQFTFGQSFAQGFSDARNRRQQAEQFALQQILDFARLEESERTSRVSEGQRTEQLTINESIEKRLQELQDQLAPGRKAESDLKELVLRAGTRREDILSDPTNLIGIGDAKIPIGIAEIFPQLIQAITQLQGIRSREGIANLQQLGADRRQQFGFQSGLVDTALQPFFDPNFGLGQSLIGSQIFRNINVGSSGNINFSPEEAQRRLNELRNQ